MKPKNIVHVISSLKMGGAENLLLTISRHLKEDDYSQTVIYFHDGPIRQLIEDLGIKTYKVSGYLYKYDLFFIVKLYKLLKQLKPDLILSALWAGNLFAILIGKSLKVKVISILHTKQEHEGGFRIFFNSLILPKANKIIAVAPIVAQSAIEKCKLSPSRITVINNGIDIENLRNKNFECKVTRKDLGLSDNNFIFGSVGRFVAVKNYDSLLEIAANFFIKFPNSRLLLIGSGPEYSNLKLKAKKLNIEDKVIFIINKPAYKYYCLFDCFVQPSLHEGLSLALLEALSFNIPCIVASDSDRHDVITNNVNGLICKLAQLEEHLEKVYKNKNYYLPIAKEGSQLIKQKFTAKIMIDKYKDIFNLK